MIASSCTENQMADIPNGERIESIVKAGFQPDSEILPIAYKLSSKAAALFSLIVILPLAVLQIVFVSDVMWWMDALIYGALLIPVVAIAIVYSLLCLFIEVVMRQMYCSGICRIPWLSGCMAAALLTFFQGRVWTPYLLHLSLNTDREIRDLAGGIIWTCMVIVIFQIVGYFSLTSRQDP